MRGAIPATARAALVPGRATRADVLLELGEPDWSSADEARLLFWTHEVESVGIVYLVVEGAGLTWGEDRFLLFEFDEKGLLRSQRERTRSFSSEQGLGRLPDEAECAKLFEEAPAAPGVRTP